MAKGNYICIRKKFKSFIKNKLEKIINFLAKQNNYTKHNLMNKNQT